MPKAWTEIPFLYTWYQVLHSLPQQEVVFKAFVMRAFQGHSAAAVQFLCRPGIMSKQSRQVTHFMTYYVQGNKIGFYSLCTNRSGSKNHSTLTFLRNSPQTSKYWLTTGTKKWGNNVFNFNCLTPVECQYMHTSLKARHQKS